MTFFDKLSSEQRVLLGLVSKQMSDTPEMVTISESDLRNVDWKAIATESLYQAVGLIAFDSVNEYREYIPDDVYNGWFKMSGSIMSSNVRTAYAQSQLVELLNKNELKHLILKGLSAAKDYKKPQLRSLGDVDFLVDTSEQDKIEKLLIEQGYERWEEKEHACHVVFRKPHAHLEMHYEIAGIPFGEVGEKVRKYLDRAINKFDVCELDGNKFNTPIPEIQGAVLLLHMQHHMLGEGLGIRHMCDWLRFVSATRDVSFWEEKFLPFIKEIGLFTYAETMTKTCAIYLGGYLPEWAKNADETLCFEIIVDMFKNGNFGKKDASRAMSGNLISEHGKNGTKHGKLYNALYRIHSAVFRKFPVVRKVIILYPFLFVWISIKYFIKAIPVFGKTISVANERKSIYEKLHVFETED